MQASVAASMEARRAAVAVARSLVNARSRVGCTGVAETLNKVRILGVGDLPWGQ